MRKVAGFAIALLALAGAAEAQFGGGRPPRGVPGGPGWADPSDILQAEIAFNRLAQEKGRWKAFAATAAKGAEMYQPGPVRAATWLPGRAEPAAPLTWQPHQVWIACDGTYGVTRGAWQSGKENGWFATVWQRQGGKGKKAGTYKWILDQGDATAEAIPAPDFIDAGVAECPRPARRPDSDDEDDGKKPPKPVRPAPETVDWTSGASDDGSLTWTTAPAPGGGRRFSVAWRREGRMQPAFAATVAQKP